MPESLMTAVVCTPFNPRPCEPVKVEVLDANGQPLDNNADVSITVDGIPGAVQYLQFPVARKHTLTVRAKGKGISEKRTVDLDVSGDPVTFKPTGSAKEGKQPAIMCVRQSLANPYEVLLSIGSVAQVGMLAKPWFKLPRVPGIPVLKRASEVLTSFRSGGPLERAVLKVAKGNTLLVRQPFLAAPRRGRRFATSAVVDLGNADVRNVLQSIGVAVKTRYEWDFGDGDKAVTPVPQVVHDFFKGVDHHAGRGSFHVRCRIVHENVEVTRTLTLHSVYAVCRSRGYIVPHVVADTFASKQFTFFVGSFEVHNIEKQPLKLDKQAVVPLSENPEAMSVPVFKPMQKAIVIAPESSSIIGAYVTMDDVVPYDAPGFTVYYAGSTPDGVPVRVSVTFEVPLADRDTKPWFPFGGEREIGRVWPWEEVEKTVQDLVTNPPVRGIVAPGRVTVDRGTGSIAVSLAGAAKAKRSRTRSVVDPIVRAGIVPGHQQLLRSAGAGGFSGFRRPLVTPVAVTRLGNLFGPRYHTMDYDGPPLPGPVAEGQVCDPDNLTEEDLAAAEAGQLVCQLTDEEDEYEMPGRFMNARKGDVVLSPGGVGLIANLLRMVDPPQRYSHTGIMTRNYDEVTHATASEKRLMDYKVGFIDDGTDGIEPRVLKYMWPGVVTQSVEASVNGEKFVDPENGEQYSISGFSGHAIGVTHNGHFEIVHPVVVKPDPLQESAKVRSELHAVATDARGQGGRPGVNSKSHYRLYCYTDPTIGLTTTAPAEAGWAAGTFPSVCSSFVWRALRKRGVHLEADSQVVMPGDLEAADVAQGAFVRPGTPDGLYTYTAEERLAAGEWLYEHLYDQVFDQAGWFGNFLTDSADDVANQFVNTLANDNPDKDSDAWRSASDADAVSPDNVLWWDSPQSKGLYGFAEPLIYREPRVEKYRVSRWKKVLTRGNVSVKITYQGKPVGGAHVQLGQFEASTKPDGRCTFTDVPFGAYLLKADKVINGSYKSIQVPMSLYVENLTWELEIQDPPDAYRLAQVYIDFWGKDEETFGDNEYTDPGPEYYELELGPDRTTNSLNRTYKWGGELRVEYKITVRLLVNNTIDVEVHGVLYEGTDEETKDLDGQGVTTFQVPVNKTVAAVLEITNTDEDDDDRGKLAISVKNVQNNN